MSKLTNNMKKKSMLYIRLDNDMIIVFCKNTNAKQLNSSKKNKRDRKRTEVDKRTESYILFLISKW